MILTKFLKDKNLSYEFKKDIKNKYKNLNIDINNSLNWKTKKILLKRYTNPIFFGTFADEYILYKINKKLYINELEKQPWYWILKKQYESYIKKTKNEIIDEKALKKFINENTNNKNEIDFYLITFSILYYRSGLPSEERFENFKKDFKNFDKLIKIQIKKYIKNKKVIFSPSFRSPSFNIIGDADLILEKKLVEIKCTMKPKLEWPYIFQLLGYYCLNQIKENQYQISNEFIYWNPLYDIFCSFEINVEDLINFKKIFLKLIKKYKN